MTDVSRRLRIDSRLDARRNEAKVEGLACGTGIVLMQIKPIGETDIPRRVPTWTVNGPEGTSHFLRDHVPTDAQQGKGRHHQHADTHHTLMSFSRNGTCTVVVCPPFKKLLSKPRSTFGGDLAPAGKPRYTWLTSWPSVCPVFVTV